MFLKIHKKCIFQNIYFNIKINTNFCYYELAMTRQKCLKSVFWSSQVYQHLYSNLFNRVGHATILPRQPCRNNVTMFKGYKVVGYCIITTSLCLLHFDSIYFYFFLSLKLFSVMALSLLQSYKILTCPALILNLKEF